MKVSVLISSYNNFEDLRLLLPSLAEQDLAGHEMEVIVRDDGSTDGTAEKTPAAFPWVLFFKGENLGFAKSNNEAFRRSTGEIICCVNGDTVLAPGFMAEALGLLEERPEAAGINVNMLMPWIMSLEEFLAAARRGGKPPFYEYRLTPHGATRYEAAGPEVRETNFISGGGFFLRRSVLGPGEELFDPRISSYCEDTDLSLRVTGRGGVLLYCPAAVIYHNQAAKRGSSLGELKKLFGVTWNRFSVLARRGGPWKFSANFPLYLWGIIVKMDDLGLPPGKKPMAYLVGGGLAVFFFLLFPYWLLRARAKMI